MGHINNVTKEIIPKEFSQVFWSGRCRCGDRYAICINFIIVYYIPPFSLITLTASRSLCFARTFRLNHPNPTKAIATSTSKVRRLKRNRRGLGLSFMLVTYQPVSGATNCILWPPTCVGRHRPKSPGRVDRMSDGVRNTHTKYLSRFRSDKRLISTPVVGANRSSVPRQTPGSRRTRFAKPTIASARLLSRHEESRLTPRRRLQFPFLIKKIRRHDLAGKTTVGRSVEIHHGPIR